MLKSQHSDDILALQTRHHGTRLRLGLSGCGRQFMFAKVSSICPAEAHRNRVEESNSPSNDWGDAPMDVKTNEDPGSPCPQRAHGLCSQLL